MKQSAHEAARSLGLHPANLLLHLSSFGMEFGDVWPDVDTAWIETLKQSDWEKFGYDVPLVTNTNGSGPAEEQEDLGVTDDAALIIEKLWRNERWGNAYVRLESIQRHTHLAPDRLKAAMVELVKLDLLEEHGSGGPYSLNTGRRAEIDRIARIMVARGE